MVSRFILFFCSGVLLLLFASCYDNPDPVGSGSFSKNDLIPTLIDTLCATQHTSTKAFLYTQNLERVMLGINTTTDNWKYEAWACIKFFRMTRFSSQCHH